MRSSLTASKNDQTIGVLYGFRALMVLLVCNFHIWQQSWFRQGFTLFGQWVSTDYITRSSYLFVDGMILLSGFLLFLPYARAMQGGDPAPRIRDFFRNRALRILPTYLVAIAIMLLIANNDAAYSSADKRAIDVATHLTFTFNFNYDTWLLTPLGTALWTVCVEVQLYLLFPLLCFFVKRKPALTLSLMAVIGIGFRLAVGLRYHAEPLLINQTPAFFDVFALGFVGAMAYSALEKQDWMKAKANQALLVAIFALTVWLILLMLREQSQTSVIGQEELRRGQLLLRLPFAATILMSMLSASFMLRPFQWLLSNRLMRFLSTISYGLYVCHQPIAARLAKYTFPSSLHGDRNLQIAFTLLCFSLSIVLSMLTTFGVEKPTVSLANTLRKRFGRKDHEGCKTAKAEPPAG